VRERESEKEGEREREKERKREREKERERVIILKRNDGCLGTFKLSSSLYCCKYCPNMLKLCCLFWGILHLSQGYPNQGTIFEGELSVQLISSY
jgi:hypothetical protein